MPEKRTIHLKVDEKVWRWLTDAADRASFSLSALGSLVLKQRMESGVPIIPAAVVVKKAKQ